jgi:enoyl-CoA hydratase/carnithine racemase
VRHLHYRQEGTVAILTLDRPEHGNRVSQQMAEELAAEFERLRRDPNIRACVLTGSGDTFCLGGDHVNAGSRSSDRMNFTRAFSDTVIAMSRLGKPIIAAVNGNAHAGGFSLVAACDMAVLADDATMGLPEAAKDFFPMLALAVVRHTLPRKVFFEIVYGAKLLSAKESLVLHLVNKLAPRADVFSSAMASAEMAASLDPHSVSIGRDLFHATQAMSLEQALEHARMAVVAGMAAGDDRKQTQNST